MINQSDYDGKYAVFNNASSKSFLVADQCSTAQLLTVSCPAPLCGRKALALQETGLEENIVFNSLSTTTSSSGEFS